MTANAGLVSNSRQSPADTKATPQRTRPGQAPAPPERGRVSDRGGRAKPRTRSRQHRCENRRQANVDMPWANAPDASRIMPTNPTPRSTPRDSREFFSACLLQWPVVENWSSQDRHISLIWRVRPIDRRRGSSEGGHEPRMSASFPRSRCAGPSAGAPKTWRRVVQLDKPATICAATRHRSSRARAQPPCVPHLPLEFLACRGRRW
jgi:hypothetical protein